MYGSEAGRTMEEIELLGRHIQIVCLIRRVEKRHVLPGEGELMYAPGWDGRCVEGGYHFAEPDGLRI